MRPITCSAISATVLLLGGCKTPDGARSTTSRTASGSVAPGATGPPSRDQAGDSIIARADRARILGDSTAPVWFIMASDFECPFCKMWHDSTFAPVVQNYVRSGKIRMAYLNYPLPQHLNAMPAAEAAMCAAAQGKFWPMHDSLFAQQEKWASMRDASPVFEAMASRVGAAMADWRQCVSRHSTAPLIQADRDRAGRAGVRSTPTFFVGDKAIAGAAPYATFRDTIEAVLTRATAGRGKPPAS